MTFQTFKITLPAKTKGQEFVAMAKNDWDKFKQRYEELEHALKMIVLGERELRAGKTRQVGSLKELMR